MEYGYVCFAYTKTEWLAKAIAWFTKSQWSHTFLTVPQILGQQMVMEAGGGGVEMATFDQNYRTSPNQKYEVYRVNLPQETIDKAITVCLYELEIPYGYLEYPWFIWRFINKWLGRDIKSQDNWSTDKKVCAGLVDIYMDALGLQDLSKDFGNNSITAQDIYEIVKANPQLFTLIESKD